MKRSITDATASSTTTTTTSTDMLAAFDTRPDLAIEFMLHTMCTNIDNSILTANLKAVRMCLVQLRLRLHCRQILVRAATEDNVGTLLRNLINVHHMELARGAFVWLRCRGLVAKAMQPPPSASEVAEANASKRNLLFKDPAAVDVLRAGEFNESNSIVDSTGKDVLTRTQVGTRWVYRFAGDSTEYLYDLDDLYLFAHDKGMNTNCGPDSWVGDYFLDSYATPILFRCRGVATSDVKYFRIVTAAKMAALVAHDEVTYAKLVDADEQQVYDDITDESEQEDEDDDEEEEVQHTHSPTTAKPRVKQHKKAEARARSPTFDV